ncbi:HNH endonuclease [Nocardioides sp. TF02-7]|uniref:HNH endonuclease signature motif containing protein n=1 Tax=Nocardioides sp. TF02-7 TaxID=2917724 RepID=UPI001F055F99|nr:HNH endonuclease [Nocardioides sp. TF02-7]UMG92153.1 HNH endonuclease [Nocardioides sp. TF02-7]
MELGTAPLFDLPAATAARVVETEPAVAEVPVKTFTHELLDLVAEDRAVLAARELALVQRIAHWANLNTISSAEGAATLTERGLDTGLPVAGEGAPLISDFAIIELAPILGRSLDSARSYVGCVVELSHRLPQIWAKVGEGVGAGVEGAADRRPDPTPQPRSGRVRRPPSRPVRRGLLVGADRPPRRRSDHPVPARPRRSPPPARGGDATIRHRPRPRRHRGCGAVDGVLDLADALDLERAVSGKARELASLGDEDSLDVRRSKAVGEIARDQLTLDLTTDSEQPAHPRPVGGRGIELFVHLAQDALTDRAAHDEGACVGRLQNLQVPVTAEQIRQWCGAAGRIIVRPVLDLAGCEPIDAYEIPDRHRRIVVQRDHHCVFPGCTKRAERCDVDHTVPHAQGGVTCPCNEAALCRGHHRAKTHAGWSYERLAPTVYLWTSPSRHRYLVTAAGTRAPPPGR